MPGHKLMGLRLDELALITGRDGLGFMESESEGLEFEKGPAIACKRESLKEIFLKKVFNRFHEGALAVEKKNEDLRSSLLILTLGDCMASIQERR